MGARFPRTLMDYPKFGLDLGARCRTCSRLAVFDGGEAAMFFISRSLNSTVPVSSRSFVCRCGSREVDMVPVPMHERPEPLPERKAALAPIYVRQGQRK